MLSSAPATATDPEARMNAVLKTIKEKALVPARQERYTGRVFVELNVNQGGVTSSEVLWLRSEK